jgi:acetyltransferase-like isoleucine patch superfamily enzyme
MLAALRLSGPLFFERGYLSGRHFNSSHAGWAWVLRSLFTQKLAGFNRHVPWPVSPFIGISEPKGIDFHPDDLNNFQTFGTYFSNNGGGRISLGRGTYIAPNVGLITTNHDPLNPDRHLAPKHISLGESCWVGMNSVILPGVSLGDHTVVAAGSVVTTSFPEGWCVVGGVPARKLRDLSLQDNQRSSQSVTAFLAEAS